MKKLAITLIFNMLIQFVPWGGVQVFADEQEPPLQLSIDQDDGKPIIAYSPDKGNYVRLKWNAPAWSGDTQYYQLYYAEDGNAFEKYGSDIALTQTSIDLEQLKSGTVYHVYIKAIHEHYDENGNFLSEDESVNSNEVVFLTNIEVTTKPGGTDMLEIEWTDAIYKGRRLNYQLFISESKSFSETPPLYIRDINIGPTNTVKPVEGKLVYKATDLKAGTIYYAKIQPIISDDSVIYQEETKIVSGFTYILAKISKISSDWWKLEWNPITNTNLGQNEEIMYKIKRCLEGDLEKEISATKDVQMFIKVVGTNTYYRIQADVVTELEETVSVISSEIYAHETDVPSTPTVPEVMDQLSDEIMEVGPDSLKILWKVPVTIDGELDEDILYDIWMLTDPEDINNPAVLPAVSNLQVNPENYLYELVGNSKSDRVIGYKHTIDNLSPNKIYYLKMVAKKSYIVNENGSLINKDYCSEPALKVIITLPDGSIEQPVTPAKPPLKVKTEVINSKTVQVVTPTTVTLEWKNQWYEVWRDVYSRWEYIPSEEVEQAAVQGEVYRFLSYDEDIKFSVGYEVYSDNFDFSRLEETLSPMPMQFNDIPNSTSSDTIDFEVTGLDPNTTYVMWIRAYRSNFLKSGLSDPLIITTKPEYEMPLAKPSIPVFNYKFEGDTYAEIGWNIVDNYNYSIKYSTVDDLNQAEGSIELTAEQLKYKTKYRVEGLTPNTVCYFWIKASVKDENGGTLEAEWSDSYIIKTTPYAPPEIPTGFGLKNIAEPIGKDFMYFEWVKATGLEYTLEIGKKDDFSDSVTYNVKDVSEYKVEKLDSNTRYYARLFAYDPKKELKSNYTASISARTKKSYEEYYSDADLDSAVIDFIKPGIDKDGLVSLDLTDKNVNVFIQQIYHDGNINYTADFSNLTTNSVLKSDTRISPRVLTALQQMKKTLTLDTGNAAIVVMPGIMDNRQIIEIYQKDSQSVVKIDFEKVSNTSNKPSGATLVSDIWRTTLVVETNGVSIPVRDLQNLIRIKIPYSTSTWYDKSTMSGYVYDEQKKSWTRVETTNKFDKINSKGFIYAELPGSSDFAIMKSVNIRFSDISGHKFEADIKSITDKYDLKSLGYGQFEPNKSLTKGEAVKILLDIMNYEYDNNYLDAAAKAKITLYINMEDTNGNVTRQEAASMIARVYELLAGKKAESSISLSGYSDANLIDANLLPRMRYAVEKGIIGANSSGLIRPSGSVTRAEMMVMLKKMLVNAGQM